MKSEKIMFRSSRNHPRGPYQSRSNRNKRHNFTGLFVAFIAIISFSLLICKSPDGLDEQPFSFISSRRGSIIPFDLSVCHLQLIELAGGALSHQVHGVVEEDFLPIVTSDSIHLRFRLKPSLDASPAAVRDISAYRIIAKPAHNDSISLWDSGKVRVKSMPHSIPWNGDTLKVGSIVKWNVMVWDDLGVGPYSSQFTKFAVGPSSDEWTGQWIAHPEDVTRFENVSSTMWESDISPEKCKAWKARRPLPLARARLQLSEEEASNVVSALLVASGLGSFATTLDGRSLSSSSILDPPMTDFSQRVSYRGYDITKHLQITKNTPHVVGIALGSGWWDARPLTGGIIKPNLLPQGPLTTIAELHITLKDGSSVVKIPSGMNDWEIAKGFIRDSDLFTGDTIDLGAFQAMRNWDSPHESSRNMLGTNIVWMEPVLYHSDSTLREWRKALSERAGAMERSVDKAFSISPIGKLVPLGTPPVMPIERLAPESIKNLGDGRWLFDFGKAMSGVLRFDAGLPNPIVPETYPRSHKLETKGEEEFITVVYGDSIQMETGDINLIIVAGMGLHDGGPRVQSKGEGEDTQKAAGPCFPCDHGMVLTQRDAFVVPKTSSGRFAHARQPLFTSHGFRFAEVCCTKDPPQAVHAIAYRSAFAEWGEFHSSNVLLNGAYELSRNALNSNMLGTQTDCPHRERMQYGGDLVANSPASLHFFDLSAFYTKVVNDWIDSQWDNGAYTETSVYQDLNDGEGIGQGAGETIWASLPPVLTVRHVQHYADMQLVESTFDNHVKWMNFLVANWDAGIGELIEKKYSESEYRGNDGGLGDCE